MKLNRLKIMCLGFAIAGAGSSLAATFPSAGGDLASDGADGWNGTKPSASDAAVIGQAGTYTASADVTFGSLAFEVGGIVLDLTDGNHTITTGSYSAPTNSSAETVLKGGKLHFSSLVDFVAATKGKNSTKLTLTDGCTVDNVNLFTATGDSSIGTKVLLEKKANVSAKSLRVASNWGRSTTLEVASGASFTTSSSEINYMTTGNKATHTTETKFLIHDTGSSVNLAGSFRICNQHPNESLCVYDNASFSGTLIEIGGYTNALLEVKNGASLTLSKNLVLKGATERFHLDNATASMCDLYVGNDSEGEAKTDNHVVIVHGAELTACTVSLTGNLSSLHVTNSTFAATTFELGKYASSTGNVAVFSGEDMKLTYASNPFGSVAAGNTLVLADGASWKFNYQAYRFMTAARSKFVVTKGAVYSNIADADSPYSNWTYVGYNCGLETNCCIEVTDGGEMHTGRLGVMGYGTSLVISNALVSVGENSPADDSKFGLNIGYTSSDSTRTVLPSTDCRLVLQGTTPRVRAQNNQVLYLQNCATVRYEIPAAGYAEGYAPIETQRIGIFGHPSLEIDCADWAAAARRGEACRKIVLYRGTNNIDSTVRDWIAAETSKLNLPTGVRLKVSGKEIWLIASRGLSLLIR